MTSGRPIRGWLHKGDVLRAVSRHAFRDSFETFIASRGARKRNLHRDGLVSDDAHLNSMID